MSNDLNSLLKTLAQRKIDSLDRQITAFGAEGLSTTMLLVDLYREDVTPALSTLELAEQEIKLMQLITKRNLLKEFTIR